MQHWGWWETHHESLWCARCSDAACASKSAAPGSRTSSCGQSEGKNKINNNEDGLNKQDKYKRCCQKAIVIGSIRDAQKCKTSLHYMMCTADIRQSVTSHQHHWRLQILAFRLNLLFLIVHTQCDLIACLHFPRRSSQQSFPSSGPVHFYKVFMT